MSKNILYRKLRKGRYTSKRNITNIKIKGGELNISETDLQNSHICRVKDMDIYKESPGYEVYTAINAAFELKPEYTPFFLGEFKKSNEKWFKFVMFKNNEKEYIYIIAGAIINKHSVCMLQGLLSVTKDTGEYEELRDAFNRVIELKSVEGINVDSLEENAHVLKINEIIQRDIPCMPVIAAGSGTVNDDNSICINTKSGHYKPTIDSMRRAKELFSEITGMEVHVIKKENKEELRAKYGDRFKQFSGICL
jgi:hypothetical protein